MSNQPTSLSYASSPPPKGLFPALRHRNYQLWFGGSIVSVIGTWMTGMTLPWLMWEYTGNALYLGLLGLAFQGPMALVALPAGVLADQVSRRWMIFITQALLMVSSIAFAVLSGLGQLNEHVILFIAVLRGIVQGFDMTGRQSFVLEMVDRESLPSAVAMNSVVFNTGRVVGPSLAGVLLAWVGPTWCFTVDALTYLAVLVVLPAMKLKPVRRKRRVYQLHELRLGIKLAAGRPRIRNNLLLVAVMSACVLSYGTLLPAFAKQVFGGGPRTMGWLTASAGAGAVVGALLVSAFCRRNRQGTWMFLAMLVAGAALASLALAPNLVSATLCLVVMGLAAMAFNSPANAASQLAASDRYRGRIMSLHSMTFISAMPIGGMFYGALAGALSHGVHLAVPGIHLEWLGEGSEAMGVRLAVLVGAVIAVVAAFTLGRRMMATDPK